jgi:CRP-like cAMP-binding protein
MPLAVAPAAASEATEVEPLDDLDLSLDALVPQEPSVGEVVRSPLFSDFSAGELIAIMGGLELLTFDAGDIIITEGEPGRSLFVVSSGRVKAFVRNPAGRHVQVRAMDEGSFFGEISILEGGPRTATVTAATRVDLLELDRETLDGITARYPRVLQVLEAFYRERAGSADEAVVRGMTFGSGASS